MPGLAWCSWLSASVLFSAVSLHLPGLHYDETLFANASLPGDDGTFVSWSVPFQDHRFPLMLMHHLGALKAYLYAPIFAAFGRSPVTMRLPVILAGLGTLLFTYLVVKRTLGRTVALTSLLLLASDPSFIYANRLDWGLVSLGLLLKVCSLCLLLKWLRNGKPSQLAAASFLLGLGVYDKVSFLWFVGALAIALPVCFGRQLRSRLRVPATVVSLGCFLLGCLPLALYNLKGPGRSFTTRPVLNRSLLASAAARNELLRSTLDGEAVYGFINQQPLQGYAKLVETDNGRNACGPIAGLAALSPLQSTLTYEALLVSIAVILCLWVTGRLGTRAETMFFLLLLVLTSLFMWGTADATGAHHVLTAYPLPHVVISAGIWRLAGIAGNRWKLQSIPLSSLLAAGCVAFLLFTQVTIAARYLVSFKINGGNGQWSDAIYELAQYTRQHPGDHYQLMDWGFGTQLRLLGSDAVKRTEAFRSASEAGGATARLAVMQECISRPDSPMVFHAPGWEVFPLFDLFQQSLSQCGLEARLVKTFYQRDGQPVNLVYRTVNPSFDAYRAGGGLFYLREAEDWNSQSGGGVDFKVAASLNKALGKKWGQGSSDFAAYGFDLPRRVLAVQLTLRYAIAGAETKVLSVYLDDRLVKTVILHPTGGDGNASSQWARLTVPIGPVDAGRRELRIRPAASGKRTTLDYFCLWEGGGDFSLRSICDVIGRLP